jgi:hypothetical protein
MKIDKNHGFMIESQQRRSTLRVQHSDLDKSLQLVALVIVFTLPFFTGCQTGIPKEALALSEQSLAWRMMQSRKYDTSDEKEILNASAALLQDLGFSIDDTEGELGLLVASKERSAVSATQQVGAIILALMGSYTATDRNQIFKASVATRPYGENQDSVIVRVTFQRIVWNTQNQVTKIERINEAPMYEEFFEKLSKAIFLEAQQI